MKVPGELYTRSPRLYEGLSDRRYQMNDCTGTVTQCGRICYKRRKINLSQVFAGQDVGEAARTANDKRGCDPCSLDWAAIRSSYRALASHAFSGLTHQTSA